MVAQIAYPFMVDDRHLPDTDEVLEGLLEDLPDTDEVIGDLIEDLPDRDVEDLLDLDR